MHLYNKEQAIKRMNQLGQLHRPFIFIINYLQDVSSSLTHTSSLSASGKSFRCPRFPYSARISSRSISSATLERSTPSSSLRVSKASLRSMNLSKSFFSSLSPYAGAPPHTVKSPLRRTRSAKRCSLSSEC